MDSEYRRFDGELHLLEQTNDFLFPVELWLLNDQTNRNNWRFVNLEAHRPKWAGVPILTAYVNGGHTIGSGHNMATRIDKNGEEYQSFTDATAERIVGALSDDPEDIRLEERDGAVWTVGRGYLFAFYAHELTLQIADMARQGRDMSVSIEALVTESSMDGTTEVEESYVPLGVTILGAGVQPAVPEARIAMLQAMESEFKELKMRAASYIEHPPAAETNSTRKGMKRNMRLSKQQLREIQPKFEGYTVLAAEQTENGIPVCLMRDGGGFGIYVMSSLDEAVVLDRVMPVNAQVHFCADGCDDVLVDASDLTESVLAECASLSGELNTVRAELETSKNTINAMVNAENARRLSAAKSAATATLDRFNAMREDKVDVKVLEALNKDIEAGKFTACEDESHNWTGEKAVEKEVLSLCAAAVMEIDAKNFKRAGEPMTWGSVKRASAAPGTVGELFASQNK